MVVAPTFCLGTEFVSFYETGGVIGLPLSWQRLKRAWINVDTSGVYKAAGKRHLCKKGWAKPFAGLANVSVC